MLLERNVDSTLDDIGLEQKDPHNNDTFNQSLRLIINNTVVDIRYDNDINLSSDYYKSVELSNITLLKLLCSLKKTNFNEAELRVTEKVKA